MDNLPNLHQQAINEINNLTSLKDLEFLQIKYLGRNGIVNDLLQKIKDIPDEQKKAYGSKVNRLKSEIGKAVEDKRKTLIANADSQQKTDLTLPGKPYPKGSLHLISIAVEEISRIFEKIGFIRVSYPEVEWEFFSFDALNMPPEHPARDDFEATFIDFPKDPKYGKMVLTPHTSSGQIREMWRLKNPPIRMINIAKCYRPNWDPTHTPMFYQFEGLCVDKDINITNLKGTLDYFAKEYFGPNREIRLRPYHFQFTEPSFEVDVTCDVCGGSGWVGAKRASPVQKCKVCKSGWLELGGTGMVHPNVLKAGNIDSQEYSGWAFGFGIERVIMMKYGIDDIRYYYNGDIRFLKQF